jgi:paired amphipathic helix protein Sin3a
MDAKCRELWRLLESVHNAHELTNLDVVRYRREAENHVGQDDHLYRVQWVGAILFKSWFEFRLTAVA